MCHYGAMELIISEDYLAPGSQLVVRRTDQQNIGTALHDLKIKRHMRSRHARSRHAMSLLLHFHLLCSQGQVFSIYWEVGDAASGTSIIGGGSVSSLGVTRIAYTTESRNTEQTEAKTTQ